MLLNEILLKTMKTRSKYYKYAPVIQSPALQQVSLIPHKTLSAFGRWFAEHPDATEIDTESFGAWAKLSNQTSDPLQDMDITSDLKKSQGDLPEDVETNLMNHLVTQARSIEIKSLLSDYEGGKIPDLFSQLRVQVEQMDKELNRKTKIKPCSVSIEEILDKEDSEEGLRWRTASLNKSIKPLNGGDFIIVAARPDHGKTSFIASEFTFMANQLPAERPVLWLNNEGKAEKIVDRLWHAGLNCTTDELSYLRSKGELHTRYANEVGGPNKIKVYDVHDLMSHDIEDLIKENDPGIVIFDMIDNVKFSGTNHLGGTRTDQILETMYQWGRDLAVRYDTVVVATSQTSADGAGVPFPDEKMLKDSKTGKQGAADVILFIGAEDKNSDIRYLSTPKNKRPRDKSQNPMATVIFDRQRSRFYDPVMGKTVHKTNDDDIQF